MIRLYHQIVLYLFDDQIRDEKLQYDINREAAKISVSSLQVSINYKNGSTRMDLQEQRLYNGYTRTVVIQEQTQWLYKLHKLISYTSKLWFITSIINSALTGNYFYIIL